jgi:sarcosine oxidase subunit gamma
VSARATPLHAAVAAHAPRWTTIAGMRIAASFAREGDPARLALADCSCFPRTGLKGPEAATWLARQGVAVPEGVNCWSALPGGGVIGRLATSEFFLEDGPAGVVVSRVEGALAAGAPGVYPVLRRDAALVLTGTEALEVLVQACNVNFAAVGDGALVMTSMAGVSVLVIPHRAGAVPRLRIWCDPTFGPYLYRTLLAITEELGGGPVGLARLHPNLVEGDAAS